MARLDEQSEPHPLLLAKFNEFMRAFLLAGDGGTQSWGGKVATGEKENPIPRNETADEIGYWDREWQRASTDRARLHLLKRMQPVVVRLRISPQNSTDYGTWEWKKAVAEDVRKPFEVWATYGISRATFYRVKAEVKKREE
jgi:hypothetical protein